MTLSLSCHVALHLQHQVVFRNHSVPIKPTHFNFTLCFDKEIVEECTFIDIGNQSPTEDDYVDTSLPKETSFGFRKYKALVFVNWVTCAHLEAMAWILKTRNVFGFGCQMAYLSMIYFDQYLLRNQKLWAIRLLAVACLSLTVKMEESKVSVLSEFTLDDFNFESKVNQRMEVLVLNTLEWKMGSTTLFSFIPYFISILSTEFPPSSKVSQIVELMWFMVRERSIKKPSASCSSS